MIYDWLVGVKIRLSAIVLPIMCIDTLRFIMFCKIEGTELCFIVEHVEVIVLKVIVNERGKYLLLRMCIRAKISVGAILSTMRVV